MKMKAVTSKKDAMFLCFFVTIAKKKSIMVFVLVQLF